jgi:hypothetical protein
MCCSLVSVTRVMSASAVERVSVSVRVRRRIGGFAGGACVRVGGRGAQKVRMSGDGLMI